MGNAAFRAPPQRLQVSVSAGFRPEARYSYPPGGPHLTRSIYPAMTRSLSKHPVASNRALEDAAVRIAREALEESSWANVNSTARSYISYCSAQGTPAFPLSFRAVGGFFVNHCACGHVARSLKDKWSHLRRYLAVTYGARGAEFDLSPHDTSRLRDLVTGLRKRDHSVPRRKLPVTAQVLTVLTGRIAALPFNRARYQLLVMGLVAHAALLRGSEACALRVGDVQWDAADATACTLIIHKSKANKTGPAEQVHLAELAPGAIATLRQYMRLHTPADAAARLFPCPGQPNPYKAYAVNHFRADFRKLLEYAGYPAQHYSSHSFRSGGATDLWHAGCRDHAIRLHGRWRSDTFWIYIRDNPRAQREEVAKAFALAGNRTPQRQQDHSLSPA